MSIYVLPHMNDVTNHWVTTTLIIAHRSAWPMYLAWLANNQGVANFYNITFSVFRCGAPLQTFIITFEMASYFTLVLTLCWLPPLWVCVSVYWSCHSFTSVTGERQPSYSQYNYHGYERRTCMYLGSPVRAVWYAYPNTARKRSLSE